MHSVYSNQADHHARKGIAGHRTYTGGTKEKQSVAVILLLVLIFLVPPSSASPHCEPVRIPLCKSMPYNKTRMPNLLYHSTQRNAVLIAEQFTQLVDTNCSEVLTFFLCAMFAPICTTAIQMEPVPPCRSVCQQARGGCEPIMNMYNVSWPEELDCRKLPLYDTGVCVMPEAIVRAPPKNDSTKLLLASPIPTLPSDCKCQTNLKKLKKKFYTSHKFDYAIDASLKYTKGIGAGHMITEVYIHSVLKQNQVEIPVGKPVNLWTTGACHCQAFLQRNRYIIMGYEDPDNKRLLLDDKTAIFLWNKTYEKKIKKWEKRNTRRRSRSRPSADSPQVSPSPSDNSNNILGYGKSESDRCTGRKRRNRCNSIRIKNNERRRRRRRGRGKKSNRVRRMVGKPGATG